jgi:hypothetical protein
MAGRGPTPKDPSKRRRRNTDPIPTTVVTPDGEVRGPDLPDTVKWSEQTRRWWNTWRTSPQAQSMTPTDWDFLLDTCPGRKLEYQFWPGVSCGGSVLVEQSAETLPASDPVDFGRERDHVRDIVGSMQKHPGALVAVPGVVMGDVDIEHMA